MSPAELTYRAVFSGELRPGADPGEVRRRLALLYKRPPAEIERLFSGRRIVLKRELDADRAERLRTAFRQAGAVLTLEPEGAAPAEANAATLENRRSAQRSCPACGFEQPAAEDSCLRCGIVFRKYEAMLEAARRREQQAAERKAKEAARREAEEAARAKAREAVNQPPILPTSYDPRHQPPAAPVAGSEALPVTAAAPPATNADTDPPPPARGKNEPPVLTVDPFDYSGLVSTMLLCALLNLIIIGLWKSPEMLWNFIARHLSIDGRRLSFADPWLLIRSNLSIVIGLLIYLVLMLPIMLVTAPLPSELADFLRYLVVVVLFPVILGVPHLVMLQSLWRNTRWNGRSVGHPYALRSIRQIRDTVLRHRRQLYIGGLAELAILCVFPMALGVLILLHQWTSRFEVDGYRLDVPLPPGFVVKYTLLGAVTLGLGSTWAIRAFFNQLLPAARWVKIPPGTRM